METKKRVNKHYLCRRMNEWKAATDRWPSLLAFGYAVLALACRVSLAVCRSACYSTKYWAKERSTTNRHPFSSVVQYYGVLDVAVAGLSSSDQLYVNYDYISETDLRCCVNTVSKWRFNTCTFI